MRPFFKFQAATGAPAVLSIGGDIGAGSATATAFRSQLGAVRGMSITVEVNSLGGDVFAGIAIHNLLRASGKRINVKVAGIAASAASLIAMAGDTIEMPSNTFMVIHNPWTTAVGTADEMRAEADVLDKIGTALVSTYCRRTGMSEPRMRVLLSADTCMSADEALADGFCTAITDEIEWALPSAQARVPDSVHAAMKARASAPARMPDASAIYARRARR